MRYALLLLFAVAACKEPPTRAQRAYDTLGRLDDCTRKHLSTHRGGTVETAKAACLVNMIASDD